MICTNVIQFNCDVCLSSDSCSLLDFFASSHLFVDRLLALRCSMWQAVWDICYASKKFNHITVRAICFQGNGDNDLWHSIDFAEKRDGRLPFNLLNYITKVLRRGTTNTATAPNGWPAATAYQAHVHSSTRQ